jgi:hypothetical protein
MTYNQLIEDLSETEIRNIKSIKEFIYDILGRGTQYTSPVLNKEMHEVLLQCPTYVSILSRGSNPFVKIKRHGKFLGGVIYDFEKLHSGEDMYPNYNELILDLGSYTESVMHDWNIIINFYRGYNLTMMRVFSLL